MDLLTRILPCFVLFAILIPTSLGGADEDLQKAGDKCAKQLGDTSLSWSENATEKEMKFAECILRELKWVVDECKINVENTMKKAEKEAHHMPNVSLPQLKEEIGKCADEAESAGNEPCHKKVHLYYVCVLLSVQKVNGKTAPAT